MGVLGFFDALFKRSRTAEERATDLPAPHAVEAAHATTPSEPNWRTDMYRQARQRDRLSRVALEAAWDLYTSGKVKKGLEALHRARGHPREISREEIRAAEFLLRYEHPALAGVSDHVRHDFAMSFALLWFFKSVGVSIWGMSDSPLATIIYTNYALDLDVDKMEREAWGHSLSRNIELPIRYGEIHSHFPELSSLGSLSTAARKVFFSAIQSAQIRSGLTVYYVDSDAPFYQPEDPDFAEGLNELARVGLIKTDLGPTELMMAHSAKALREFAYRHGIDCHGSKHQMIQAIVSALGAEEALARLPKLSPHYRYLRPHVSDLPLLQRYISNETARLDTYSYWLRQPHYRQLPPTTQPDRLPPPGLHDPDFSVRCNAISKLEYAQDEFYSVHEIPVVQKVWDGECDKILISLFEKYDWYVREYIHDAVWNHLSSAVQKRFSDECREHDRNPWIALENFGLLRLDEMKLQPREPRLLQCPGCGHEFAEWSVAGAIARKVGYCYCFRRNWNFSSNE